MATRKTNKHNTERKSTQPGRTDVVGSSGVYPMSGPHPKGEAPLVWPASWGQGERGAAGYEDHGESELSISLIMPGKCRDFMTKDPVICQSSDSSVVAAKLMQEHNIGALPVVGDKHQVVGIITDRDLAMRVVAQGRAPETTAVKDIMSHPVVICSPDDEWQKAIELMERYQIKRIPVIDNAGEAVGIISQADVALRIPEDKTIAEAMRAIAQPQLS